MSQIGPRAGRSCPLGLEQNSIDLLTNDMFADTKTAAQGLAAMALFTHS